MISTTQYDQLFDQSFYGWIGDVRISDRALNPRDFLAPPSSF